MIASVDWVLVWLWARFVFYLVVCFGLVVLLIFLVRDAIEMRKFLNTLRDERKEMVQPKPYGPVTFEHWLRSLEANPRLLNCEAGSETARYSDALRLWKESGYPHPGDWPDGTKNVSPFTRQWVDTVEKNKASRVSL